MSYEYTADRWSRFKPSDLEDVDPADAQLATPREWARREAEARTNAKRIAERHDETI
jgi:hypothetical protein